MKNNGNFGVINEQGFVAGNGLGFEPVHEKELNKDPKYDSNNKDKKNDK